MSSKSSKRGHSRSLLPLLLLGLPLAGCSSSSSGPVLPPGTDPGPNQFSAILDQEQEVPPPVSGTRFRVTVTNLAPELGTFQTPVWVGFHDGTFELYDLGEPADTHFPDTKALQHLAEDGELLPLFGAFDASDAGVVQGALSGELGPMPGPIAPGESVSRVFELDPSAATNRYMSYGSMVIPSNDAFIANEGPTDHEVFDELGNFVAQSFVVSGSEVLDAGTEVNDELPENTAFFGQTQPGSGVDEDGVVHLHPGFLIPGSGGILDDPMFENADFTVLGYQVLAVTFELLPPGPAPFGLASVELVNNATQVSFTVTAENLSGPVTGAHFHQGLPGVAGPVVLDIGGTIQANAGGSFLASGTLPVPAGFVSALRAGEIYLNLHTALNPAGEIRGQVLAQESFLGHLDIQQEVPAPLVGRNVRVTMSNRAPQLGTFLTPVWFGYHDGTFEIYDLGAPAITHFPTTNALEFLAEEGEVEPLQAEFAFQTSGTTQGVLEGRLGPMPGPIAPGETVSTVMQLDPAAATSQFFSYASMVIPSNDAFIANGDPQAHPIFDGAGDFVAASFTVTGAEILDAGTEVNDELPEHTPFLGSPGAPGAGIAEGGVVHLHPGFLVPGSGGILDDPMFVNADFTELGYEQLAVRFNDLGPALAASGIIVATLNEDADEIHFQVIARNLSSPVVGMHFHEGAPGIAGPVVLDLGDTVLTSNGTLTAQGTKSVTPAFVQALRAGDIYINIHTALNLTGEIRGQVLPAGAEPPSGEAEAESPPVDTQLEAGRESLATG